MKIISAILIATSLFLLQACQFQKADEVAEIAEVPALSADPAPSTYSSQTSDAEMVTVTVLPLSLEDGKEWDFEISLQTHSVELNVDLMSNTVLIDDKGTEHKPLFWTGDEPGGHHRSGILSFASVKSSEVKIKITAITGDDDERIFQWNLNN